MKFLVSLLVFISMLFLFGGMLLLGVFNTDGNSKKTNLYVFAEKGSTRLSMKQIDSLTSVYNLSFTSSNAIVHSLNPSEKQN